LNIIKVINFKMYRTLKLKLTSVTILFLKHLWID